MKCSANTQNLTKHNIINYEQKYKIQSAYPYTTEKYSNYPLP